MKSYTYRVVEEDLRCEETVYKGYGLSCNGERTVSDISTDRGFVEELASMFSDSNLSPVHLIDVLEDLIG